ncbi:NAD-dependent epimerase/dehydratase family protein [Candidatus Pelagibacter sp.]|jgi:UDP-glucose 4-epimerase|nr:NAD-dependent epimerase/dehydratase family protein [Candidatus Pelagibacter sp.]
MVNSKKKYIIITGGAGFVGSNLIETLLKNTQQNLISIDDYSSGTKKNHIKNSRLKYINGNTKDIDNLLNKYKLKITTIFHFGEFSRIYQSFLQLTECLNSNSIGTNAVFKFCLENKIKLIYSATSATLGNRGDDKNLSPYSFTKAKNLELLENLKKWFNFRYEVIFFYNVYGPRQISSGNMATVIGIFENHYLKNKLLPIVKPGTQSRRFTHIDDTINICLMAWKKDRCRYYSITSKQSYTINQVAKLFKHKIRYLPERKGERYASALTNMSLSNKVYRKFGKIKLKEYIKNFIKKPNLKVNN